ncbi:MAG: polysaccharide deacetylase family protein [Roseiflexus sp.]
MTKPVRRGNCASGKVALTFDIEIDDTTLYAILDVMRQRGVKGTFFVTGRWVKCFPDAARAIVADAGGRHCCSRRINPVPPERR